MHHPDRLMARDDEVVNEYCSGSVCDECGADCRFAQVLVEVASEDEDWQLDEPAAIDYAERRRG